MVAKRGKKAISPVVATVLLVSIVIVLIVIIYIWASSSLKEQYTKFGSPIEDACDKVSLSATYDSDADSVQLNNEGTVAVYKINLVYSSGGDKNPVSCGQVSLATAGSKTISVSDDCSLPEEDGIPVSVIPVLLGENSDGNSVEYVCENKEISFD